MTTRVWRCMEFNFRNVFLFLIDFLSSQQGQNLADWPNCVYLSLQPTSQSLPDVVAATFTYRDCWFLLNLVRMTFVVHPSLIIALTFPLVCVLGVLSLNTIFQALL